MKKIIEDLLYENDQLSLTRVLAMVGYILFAFTSLYMVFTGTSWNEYATFAMYTGGGGAALQITNKAINSKWNSAVGSYDPHVKPQEKSDSGTAAAESSTSEESQVVVPRSNEDTR